jgi:hypothetical protein
MLNLFVSISPQETEELITKTIVNGSITGELIDSYTKDTGNGTSVTVLVFDKHYYRVGNRLTLTTVIDNIDGKTHIHAIGGGGGEGLFRWDAGAAESFEDCIYDAIYKYIIE